MPGDNILQIGAEFDVAPIIAGAQQASAAMEGLGAKIEATGKVAVVGSGNVDTLAARLVAEGLNAKEAAEALVTLGYSENEAAAAIAKVSVASVEGAVALDGLASAANQVAPAMNKAAVAMEGTGIAAGMMANRMGIARVEAGALAGSARAVEMGFARLAGASAALAPLLEAAFLPLVAVFAVNMVKDFIDSIADAEIKLADLSEASGVSVVTIGELGKAVEMSGGKSDDMSASIKRLEKTISDAASGNEKAIKTLHELGIETEQWGGAIPSTNQILFQMADYLHLNAGNAEVLTAAMSALGTESVEVTNVLSKGSQGLQSYMQSFGELATEEQKQIQVAREIKAYETELGQSWDVLKLQILGAADAIIKYGVDQNPVLVGGHKLMQGLIEDWSLYKSAVEAATPFLDKYRETGLGPPVPGRGLEVPKPPIFATPEDKKEKKGKDDEFIDERDRAEAIKTTKEAVLAFDQAATKQEFEDHKITLEEETNQLISEENRRIEILRAFHAAEERILNEKQKAGEDVAGPRAILGGAREADETKHKQELDRITAEGARSEMQRDQEAALNHIKLNEEAVKSDDERAVKHAEAVLKKADTPAEIGAASTDKIQAQTQAIEDQIAALNAENAVLEKGPKDKQGQLADPKGAEQLAANNVKIHELQNQLLTETETTQEETKTRTESYYAEELSLQKTSTEESLRDIEDKNRQTTEVYKRHFEERTISAQTFYKDVEKSASEEFVAEATILAQQLQMAQTYYDADLISYKEYASQKAEIDKQIADANRKMWDQINQASQAGAKRQEEDIKKLADQWGNDWVKMTNEVIQHRETISVAVRNMMGQIELQMIDNGIKKIVTQTTEGLARIVLAWAKGEAGITAAQQTGSAQQSTLGIPGEIPVIKNAAHDAAKAFHQVFNEIPIFPLNLIAATAAAGLVFAAEVAFGSGSGGSGGSGGGSSGGGGGGGVLGDAGGGGGSISAEKGAIVPADMPMFAHAKEMVLPAPISKAVQGAVPAINNFNTAMEGNKSNSISNLIQNSNSSRTETTNGGARRQHVEVNINGGSGGLKHEDIIKSVQRGIRRGEIRL